jgi:NAD(P)-dependent dehydrogenase (short-subunit alcohol dehydrogenase family)
VDLTDSSAVVTGGASGLGLATATALIERGVAVTIIDLPTSAGEEVAAKLGELASFSPADVRDAEAVDRALDVATGRAPLRGLVHCAGRGGTVRVVNKDGSPGDYDLYREIVDVNLVGSYNVLRLAAARMATNEPVDGERGACVLTASVAAFEGQVGQIAYSASKGGVAAMTITAARDLAQFGIRVNTIAPGIVDTPMLAAISEEFRESLSAGVPFPKRLATPDEYASLVEMIVAHDYLNGETIRMDGALRMAPR